MAVKKTNSVSIIQVSEVEAEKTAWSLSSSNGSESDVPLVKEETESSVGYIVLRLTVCSLCGIFFGIAMEKSRVFEPQSIRGQMVFEMFIMLKMFLSAVATGQLGLVVLSVLPPTKEKFNRALKAYLGCFFEKSLLTSAIGAFVLGAGMTISGACPGMVLIQIGTWVPNAIFTLLGCLIGALIYGMLAPWIQRLTRPKKPLQTQSVPETLKVPFFVVALPMVLVLAVIVFLNEYFWPWTKDVAKLNRTNPSSSNVITAVSWTPYASGMIIGFIQIPLVLAVSDTLGGSSAYATIVSQWVVTEKLQKLFPYLANKRCGVGNWWQVFLVCGAVIGGLVSAISSSTLSSSHGIQAHAAFFGGFIMIFGARFASGCTSGHGISGMGLLVWMSFVAVPAMFGGGIAVAFAMQAAGALDNYVTKTGGI